MHKVYDCLVVGGGIAGITATAYLKKYGYDVLLVEQQIKLGGLIGTFERDGFFFDQGIRAFENSGILFPMLKAFDIKIDMVKNPVKLGMVNDFVDLSGPNFLSEYQDMLSKYYPNEKENIEKIILKIDKVIKQMDVLYEIDNPIFLEGKYELNYVLKTLFPWLKRYKKSMKDSKEFQMGVGNYLRQFTKNQSLIDIITQHFFELTPAFFALSYFGFYREYQYPIGGTSVLIDKLESYLISNQTEIWKNTKVTSIDAINKVAYTNLGEIIRYKKLIWAGNQKSLYNSLHDTSKKKVKKMFDIVNESRGSDSVLTLNLGTTLDLKYLEKLTGPHAFFTPYPIGISILGKFEDAIDKDKYVKDFIKYTTYEISIPKLRDKNMAPEGKVGLIISTLFSYDLTKYYRDINKFEHFKTLVMEGIIDVLEKMLFKDLKNNIVLKNMATPLTIESFTGNLDGSITGWSYANKNIPAINDFSYIKNSVLTPIKDIYQCGQWTFSPAGMPTSVLTGKVASDKIIKGKRKHV